MANLDGSFGGVGRPGRAGPVSGDLTVAEDAVQEAFAEALRAWRATACRTTRRMGLTVARKPRPRPIAAESVAKKGLGGL